MATDIRSLPAYLSNDTDFRAFCVGIDAQLLAMGLVNTSDTGQLTLASATKPVTTNTGAGSRMYRFADTLQATVPVFIKVEYGVGGAVDRPSMWITVGSSTNGANTITGVVGSQRQLTPSASKTAGTTLNSYCSGSTNRLSLCTNVDPAANSFGLTALIERPKNASGADQSDGIVTMFAGGQTTGSYQFIPSAGVVPTASSYAPIATPSGALSVVGSNVALLPVVVYCGKVLWTSWCAYVKTDIGALSAFTASHLGATHTFMPMGDSVYSVWNQSALSTITLALPWE